MMGLGLVHPWLLAALAAVGLPVLIHYLTRARPRRIKYPPYHLLVEACAGRQAVYRLREWILLALRSLAVAALVLVFARPFWRAASAEQASGAGQRVVLVVDASLSMRAVQGGVSLFTKAQAEASEVLRGLPAGAAAAVILAGSQPRETLPALSRNLAALHQGLIDANPTLECGDAPAAVARARQLLAGPGTVYVFSDFQSNNWGAVSFAEWPDVGWKLRPVTRQPVGHAAIVAGQFSPAEPVVGESIDLTCRVFNSSPHPRQETVRLQLASVTREAGVELPPFGTRDVSFTFTLPGVGCFPGKISLAPDDLPEDNTHNFTVRVQEKLRALVLSDSDLADRSSAAFFLGTALSPSPAATPGLSVVRRHTPDADRPTLETTDIFVIVAPATLATLGAGLAGETAAIIARRVNEGSRLIVWLDGPTAAGIVGSLAAASQATISPPFELQQPVTAPAGATLVAPAGAEREFKLLAEIGPSDLAMLTFRRHYQTRLLDGRAGEVRLSFADGATALSLASVGRGAVVFANLPATPDSGNVVGHPLFPSLVHEVLRALRRGTGPSVTTPGQPWQIDAPPAEVYRVVAPNGETIEATPVSSGRTVRLALPPAQLTGHYEVQVNGQMIAAGAVNTDPRESDTRAVDLTALSAGGGSVTVLTKDNDLGPAEDNQPLWPALAGIAAGAVIAEMLLLTLWGKSPRRTVRSEARSTSGVPDGPIARTHGTPLRSVPDYKPSGERSS